MHVTPQEAERIAETMSALATPARVLILARLLESPATVTELIDDLGLGQSAISNHLRILRHLNLVSGTRDGRNVVYQLQDEHVREMIEQVLSHTEHG